MIVRSQDNIYTSFNGSDEFIRLGVDSSLEFPSNEAFTLTADAYFDGTVSGTIISNRDTGFSTNYGYGLGLTGLGEVYFYIIGGGSGDLMQITTTSTVPLNTRVHISCSKTTGLSASGASIFFNGILQPVVTTSDTLTLFSTYYSSFAIGQRGDGVSYFIGGLSNIGVFNVHKDSSEILDIIAKGSLYPDYSNIEGVVSYFHLGSVANYSQPVDEMGLNSATAYFMTEENVIAEDNDTPNNQGLVVSSQPTIHTILDGSDEYMVIPYKSDLVFNVGKTNSIAFWFKTTDAGDVILYSNLDGADAWNGFFIGMASGKINLQLRRAYLDYHFIQLNNAYNDNEFHSCVITYTGSSNASGYLAYIDKVSAPYTVTSNDSIIAHTSVTNINIGRHPAFGQYYEGGLDEMSFYNTVLPQVDVDKFHDRGRVFPDYTDIVGLVYHTRFNTLNPVDEVGTSNATSYLMSIEDNIVPEEGDITDNQALVIKKYYLTFTIAGITSPTSAFNPVVTTTESISWDFGDGTTFVGNSPSYRHADNNDYVITMGLEDYTSITSIFMSGDSVKGLLDLFQLTNCTSYNFNTTTTLTEVRFPVSSAIVTKVWVYTCDITGTLDLRGLSRFGGSFSSYFNYNMTKILNPISSEVFTFYQTQSCGLTGTLDVSGLSGLGGVFKCYSNSGLTGIRNPISSEVFTLYQAYSCGLVGTLDLSGLTGLGGDFRVSNQTGLLLTEIINPISSQIFTFYYAYSCGLIGTLDISGLTALAGRFYAYSNIGLTSITNPATNGVFSNYRAYSCDLGYIDFTVFTGVNDGIYIDVSNNGMTDAEVDHILVDLDNTGWINGTIRIHGTNSAPTDGSVTTYDGLTAIDNITGLEFKGWTIVVS